MFPKKKKQEPIYLAYIETIYYQIFPNVNFFFVSREKMTTEYVNKIRNFIKEKKNVFKKHFQKMLVPYHSNQLQNFRSRYTKEKKVGPAKWVTFISGGI